MRALLPTLAALGAALPLGAQTAAEAVSDSAPAIIPEPVSLVARPGRFVLTAATVISTDRATADVGAGLADDLAPATGWRLAVRDGPADGAGIVLRVDTALARLGPEGYRLTVTPQRIEIRGSAPAGVFYGVQTLRQLLPPAVFRAAPVDHVVWAVPAVVIEDYPRFAWRGMHLDVARHFMPKAFVERFIDLLALHKFNRFHWHLTDDQGWRIEIPQYPRLTAVGAWRAQTLVGPEPDDTTQAVYDGTPYGGYYTDADIAEIVRYAARRFVTVVPEIEMPGHSQAAVSAYPWLGATGQPVKVKEDWGVSDWILAPSDSAIRFMEDVLTQVMALFPSRWIHTGGDEAAKAQWQASAAVQARMQALGIGNEDSLQGWFTARIDSFLTAHGRTLVGWDEILDGGLSPNAVVMSWRGVDGGLAAARAGHDAVMAPGRYTYFDHYQSADRAQEPLAIGGFLPLDSVYAYDPVPDSLAPDEARHILGVQGQLWTEYLPDPRHVEYMMFPRAAALAEVAWTPRGRKDWEGFLARLPEELARLDALGVEYRPLAGPPWPAPAAAGRAGAGTRRGRRGGSR